MIEICDLKSFDGKMNEPDRDGHLGGVRRDFAKGVGVQRSNCARV